LTPLHGTPTLAASAAERGLSQDQSFDLLYLLMFLVLPVSWLLARWRRRNDRPTPVTVLHGGKTYEGTYHLVDGMVFVLCEAGRRGAPVRNRDSHRTAEELLSEIYGLNRQTA
jgi:hypothetical protein